MSAGHVRKSPRRNKVGDKTGKVRKSNSATRSSLNGKSTVKKKTTVAAPEVAGGKEEVARETRKPIRAPELDKSPSLSSYERETDNSDDDDGKHVAGRVVQKPAIAVAVEETDDNDDCADKKEATKSDEEEDD